MRSDKYIEELVATEIAVSHAVLEGVDQKEPEPDPMSPYVPWILGGTLAISVLLGIAGVIAVIIQYQ